ncbi:MAG: ABC transporter permease [Anaerolineales bacterium]|nr:ABC transporter permease [Anaerolineales bacterium]
MMAYSIRRLLILPVTLFGMSVIIFLFIQLLGPETRASFYINRVPRNPAVLEGIIKRYGFRDPLPEQYWNWVYGKTDPQTGLVEGGLLRGNFGFSRFGGVPVADLIRSRFPATLELTLFALVPILLLGVSAGINAAVNHNRWVDQALRLSSIIGYSIPGFVLGLLLLMIFYADRGWFPAGRVSDWVRLEILQGTFEIKTGLFVIDSVINGRLDVLWDALRHLVLPVLTLSYVSVAAFLRISRSSMLEVLHQDFIVTARAKGITEDEIVRNHALPNALLPVVTYSGVVAASSLSGVVIIETIFNFPGMGYTAMEAALQFDVATVLGVTMLAGVIVVASNLLVDILYGFLDPRIRLH